MKHLPVPPLRQSLDRYLRAVRPLLDANQQRRAEEVVERFANEEGPVCQAALLRLADEENAAGSSWLSQAWRLEYLADRSPLPLSSNVGFRVRPRSEGVGMARAADVIRRIASVHLAYLRGEIPPEVSARGQVMDMSQWQVLAGGVRRPRQDEDVFMPGRAGANRREVGVLWQGRLVMMPISDAAGQPLTPRVLEDALHRLQVSPPKGDDTFTHLSYLGGDSAAAYLDALMEDPINRDIHARLVDAVFLVNLTDTLATAEHHQERVTFHLGQAWAYKPFTYQVSLVEDFVAVHVEHSIVDGVTLRAMVELMQDAKQDQPGGEEEPVSFETLVWSMPEHLREQLARDLDPYQRAAEQHRVRIFGCPIPVPPELPFAVSHDAIQQFVLLFAQMTAYGRPRSVYEAVDMREFQAGRTECLRPVTSDALALVQSMVSGTATTKHVVTALAAHKEQVIACKTGQGFDRHLFGLRLMGQRLGLHPELFDDESYRLLTTDFLSTTSVGTDQQIVRFTFAPTSQGGIGVNYTVAQDEYEFCLSYRADQVERIEEFIAAVEAGVHAFRDLLTAAREDEGDR